MQTCEWLRGPVLDRAMIWSWVPFASLVIIVRPGGHAMLTLLTLLLAFSFSHQTLTLPLVYGDAQVFRSHRGLFTIGPFLALATVGLLVHNGLVIVLAVIGAAWNAEHTLMQRFGLVRIYGRKAGQADAGIELPLLFVWFFVALAAIAARGADSAGLDGLGLGGVNRHTVEILDAARPVGLLAVAPLVATGAAVTARWWREEFHSGRPRNQVKHEYLVSTGALFAVAIVHPVAGLLGFVGSHAVEYYVIVDKTARTRYGSGSDTGASFLARVGATRIGLLATGLLYVVAMVGFVYAWRADQPRIYTTLVLSVGALHFAYDTFIWKLRKPANATSLGLRPAASAGARVS